MVPFNGNALELLLATTTTTTSYCYYYCFIGTLQRGWPIYTTQSYYY